MTAFNWFLRLRGATRGAAMMAQPQLVRGRLEVTPARKPGRLQLGGGRPPHDGGTTNITMQRRRPARTRRASAWRPGAIGLCALAAWSGGPAHARAPDLPDLSGVYRCEARDAACNRFGSTLRVTQSGDELQIRSDKGDAATAKLTSGATLTGSTGWNMRGLIPQTGIIVWSNGATWRRQQSANDGRTS